jgi:hypothetical protein
MGYLFMAAIVASVDRGKRQAFSIGAVIVIVGYGVLVTNGTRQYNMNAVPRNLEFESFGRLPTTQLLNQLYEVVVVRTYRDEATGQILSDFDPDAHVSRQVRLNEASPNHEYFMSIGHVWWALLLAYLGGHFARFVYLRRTEETSAGGR